MMPKVIKDKIMLLCESGINWNWFYECEEIAPGQIIILKEYRIHKYEVREGHHTISNVDGYIAYWHNGQGISGHRIVNTHIDLYDGRRFKFLKEK